MTIVSEYRKGFANGVSVGIANTVSGYRRRDAMIASVVAAIVIMAASAFVKAAGR